MSNRRLLDLYPKGASCSEMFRKRNEDFDFRNAMGGPEFTERGRRPQLPTNASEHYRAAPTSFDMTQRGRSATYDKMFGMETDLNKKGRPL